TGAAGLRRRPSLRFAATPDADESHIDQRPQRSRTAQPDRPDHRAGQFALYEPEAGRQPAADRESRRRAVLFADRPAGTGIPAGSARRGISSRAAAGRGATPATAGTAIGRTQPPG